tara:strand:+ start:2208 stop:3005 length:798 start_codon:yes stop_codon:yes gene_type:complete
MSKGILQAIYENFVGQADGLPADLTAEREEELFDQRDAGDESAKFTVALHFVRLIVQKQRRHVKLSTSVLPDALSSALERTAVAAGTFDRSTGRRFSAHAELFIMGALWDTRAGAHDSVYAGAHGVRQARRVRMAENDYLNKHDDMPSDEWLADHLDRTPRAVALSRSVSEGLSSVSGYVDVYTTEGEDDSPSPHKVVEATERSELMDRAKGRMTEKQREAFEIVVEQGRTWKDARGVLGITDQAIGDRLAGARAKVLAEVQGEK